FRRNLSQRNVVVLNENLVTLLSENVGDFARNGCHRAATAQEEVVSLTGTAWHGGDPPATQQWSRAECRPSRIAFEAFDTALRCNPVTLADNPPQSLDSMSSLSLDVRGHVWGAVMKCLACGADNKMLLTDVVRDNTVKPVIERQIYMCSACKHFARRLVFR